MSPHTDRRVADRIIERLADLGVDTLFGVHGANIEDVFDAASRHPAMTPVIAKHEFAAAAMADGRSRIHGHPTAVAATSGGGALNLVAALGESYDSRVPVLAVIGSAPKPGVGRGGFQDMLAPPDTIDIVTVLAGVVGGCLTISAATDVDMVFDEATRILRGGLPVAIIVGKDVQATPLPAPTRGGDRQQDATSPESPTAEIAADEVTALRRLAAELVDIAVQPGDTTVPGRICLWAGEEASRLELRDELEDLASLMSATVVTSPGGRDLAGDGFTGITGVMGHPSAHRAIADAEFCLILGCRISMTDRAGLDEPLATKRAVHVGGEPPRAPDIVHLPTRDLRAAVGHLIVELERRGLTRRALTRTTPEHLITPGTEAALPMRTAVEMIGAALPPGCAVFADAGNAGAATIHHLPEQQGRFVVALGMGGMGYAIAAGIGAAVNRGCIEGTRTVVIAGDGAYLMHGMELHTAVEYDVPVTLIVLNNNAHGMCVTREARYFPQTSPTLNVFRPADIAAGAAALFPTLTVRHAVDVTSLQAAAADIFPRSGPALLVVDVDPYEIPPFAPFLQKGLP